MILIHGRLVLTNSLLLDNCALLWIGASPKCLSAEALQRIESASSLCVSAVTLWEIAFKNRLGKLELSHPPKEWFDKVCRYYDITVLPLTPQIMVDAAALPLHHRDPADRFIIATALSQVLDVVSADGRFREYGVQTIA